MTNFLNLKLVIIQEYQNIKTFSQISQEGFVIKKVKNAILWTYPIEDLSAEEIVSTF